MIKLIIFYCKMSIRIYDDTLKFTISISWSDIYSICKDPPYYVIYKYCRIIIPFVSNLMSMGANKTDLIANHDEIMDFIITFNYDLSTVPELMICDLYYIRKTFNIGGDKVVIDDQVINIWMENYKIEINTPTSRITIKNVNDEIINIYGNILLNYEPFDGMVLYKNIKSYLTEYYLPLFSLFKTNSTKSACLDLTKHII